MKFILFVIQLVLECCFIAFYNHLPRYGKLIAKITTMLFLVTVYCLIWELAEFIIYGFVTDRVVDNVMMVLFLPLFYISSDWLFVRREHIDLLYVIKTMLKKERE